MENDGLFSEVYHSSSNNGLKVGSGTEEDFRFFCLSVFDIKSGLIVFLLDFFSARVDLDVTFSFSILTFRLTLL